MRLACAVWVHRLLYIAIVMVAIRQMWLVQSLILTTPVRMYYYLVSGPCGHPQSSSGPVEFSHTVFYIQSLAQRHLEMKLETTEKEKLINAKLSVDDSTATR